MIHINTLFLLVLLSGVHLSISNTGRKTKLPTVQKCTDEDLNYCGGDEERSKYPEDTIADVLNSNGGLKTAVLTLRKYFQPEKTYYESNIINLDKLACKATRQKIPRYTRAKNVNGNWRYLVQQSENNIQEVEIVVCEKNEKSTCRTEEFDDTPNGSTTCKQIFSTRKLLAVDEDGVISVDSFQLPSACLCKYIGEDGLFGLRKTQILPQCKVSGTQLTDDTFTVNDAGLLESSSLKDAAKNIKACADNYPFCDDTSGYPSTEIDALLSSHLQHEYFKNVLSEHTDKACRTPTEGTISNVIRGKVGLKDNFVEGELLCGTIDKENFPTKAISTSGKLKYIVNTDNYKQIVSTSICRHLTKTRESTSCKYGGVEGNFPEVTQCQQLFWKQELLSISEEGSIEFDTFKFPSVCACHIVDDVLSGWLD